jgi:hypothetical protein
MADRFASTTSDNYKSSSGVNGTPSDVGSSTTGLDGSRTQNGGEQMNSGQQTLPEETIESTEDNSPLKFPEDLADDFYISFNAFKHSMERPKEARRAFTYKKSIILPIPTNLTDGNSTGYNAESLGILGNAVRDVVSNQFIEKGIGGAVKTAFSKEGVNQAASSVADLLDALKGNSAAVGRAALTGAVGLSQGLPGGLAAAARSSFQLTTNPFPVMIFQGTGFKPAFTFDWTMYPESASEAKNIKTIVGFFRREMLPERIETNTSLLRTPSIFEIKIRPMGIARAFKRCVLTNMAVNYAPSGPSFLVEQDSVDPESGLLKKYPTAVSLSLTFQEIELWLANDYYALESENFDPRSEFLY